jgi:hypothetical protein
MVISPDQFSYPDEAGRCGDCRILLTLFRDLVRLVKTIEISGDYIRLGKSIPDRCTLSWYFLPKVFTKGSEVTLLGRNALHDDAQRLLTDFSPT